MLVNNNSDRFYNLITTININTEIIKVYSIMKLFIVLIGCSFIAAQARNDEIRRMCAQQVPLSQLEAERFGKDDSDASSNIKCFMKCVWEAKGVIRNGALVADKAGERCKSTTGVDPCDLAYKYNTCLLK